jgi:hypothetical protein
MAAPAFISPELRDASGGVSEALAQRGRNQHWCRSYFCMHWPLPLSHRTKTRPNAAFLLHWPGGVHYSMLDIPKSASSTMLAFLKTEPRLRHRYLYRMHPKVLASCFNHSYLVMASEVVRAAEAGANYTGPRSPLLLTGCGFGATFDIREDSPAVESHDARHSTRPNRRAAEGPAPSGGPISAPAPNFNFAFVRHPVPRFLSALCPHKQHLNRSSCRRHVSSQRFLGEAAPPGLSTVDALALRARLMCFQARFSDEAHVRSQTFYLSSTNAAGTPVPWHAIFKIDGPSFPGQLSRLLASMLLDAGAINAEAEAIAARQAGTKRNSKAKDAAWYRLLSQVEAHPTLLCDLCHVYARDFVCLGYEMSGRCAAPQCLAGMPQWLRKAAVIANATVAAGSRG